MGPGLLKVAVKILWAPEELLRRADDARMKGLRKGGALVRAIMRRSIKFNAKQVSDPGRPPFSHVKSGGIKNLIYFEYDKATGTMAIGPAFSQESAGNIAPVPGTLERGGPSRIRLSKRKAKQLGKASLIAKIRPRPFAAPALDKFKGAYPDLFKDSIR